MCPSASCLNTYFQKFCVSKSISQSNQFPKLLSLTLTTSHMDHSQETHFPKGCKLLVIKYIPETHTPWLHYVTRLIVDASLRDPISAVFVFT